MATGLAVVRGDADGRDDDVTVVAGVRFTDGDLGILQELSDFERNEYNRDVLIRAAAILEALVYPP